DLCVLSARSRVRPGDGRPPPLSRSRSEDTTSNVPNDEGGEAVTSPKIATFHNRGTRFYEHPTKDLQVPGGTSVRNMLPKGYLKFWAAKLVAESAVEMTETGELAM